MLNKSEVKYIQSLSQKKFRDEEAVYVVEGPKIIAEALACPQVRINKIFALETWAATNKNAIGNIPLHIVAEAGLQKISHLKTANQVLAIVQTASANNFVFKKDKLALALDGIQDPGNMGTIIRIADWFGIEQIICSTDCADAYSPKVVQSAMGSLFRTSLLYTGLQSWMRQNADVFYYGAALDGQPLSSFSKIKNGVLVIGNESKGIRDGVMQLINEKITIERIGRAESLNAAVAAGIILSHIGGV